MAERKKSTFDERITSERRILRDHLKSGKNLPTKVRRVGSASIPNVVPEKKVGAYRSTRARKAVTADMDVIAAFNKISKPVPSFPEAGPRRRLYHDPQSVKAAVVTAGGLAPGLNCVIHSIVTRHWGTYSINAAKKGCVLGAYDGFVGLYEGQRKMEVLDPDTTEPWLDRGGSMLGARRGPKLGDNPQPTQLAEGICENLTDKAIQILYVIGGDGSLTVAHEIAKMAPSISVVGIPKTMDNDVLWVWQSFGFNTAVERAAGVANIMHAEAESTRRVCIMELFGAESGFVAANAALASGHMDLVLVPESFLPLSRHACEQLLHDYIEWLCKAVLAKEHAHGVVVLAEGVGALLEQRGVVLGEQAVSGKEFSGQLRAWMQGKIRDQQGEAVDVFVNQPRHNIRAVPANAHDQIYCQRLGALAVDTALAGYTDVMVSQWLTEFVLVPLELVTMGKKSINPGGMFWKQVLSSTGQPYPSRRKRK